MASVTKFTRSAVRNQLRHIERTIAHPANEDIDMSMSETNYSLAPARGMDSYSYYQQRLSELYVYNRTDVKVMAGWIVTAPTDLARNQHEAFFQATYDFLAERYGEKNCVQAVVHHDESGQPHLHFCFIPVVPDRKHGGEKVCANDVLNRTELRDFHPALQRYLDEHGIDTHVTSGITARQGGNRTVRDLKKERAYERQRERSWVHSWDFEHERNRW